MTAPLLSITDLQIEFRTARGVVRALQSVSLEIQRGEVFGVVGETGCGKTVTGLSVLRLLPPTARVTHGDIVFDGRSLLTLPERELRAVRGGQIAMIFQDPASALNPVFTIGAQIENVIREHLGLASGPARQRARETLAAVGLPDVERLQRAYPHQLSGGMQQRVMIALALACRPALIIADEPTTALDVTIQAQILTVLRGLQQQFGIALLLITHNLGVVAEMCDRLAVLYAGRVVEAGPARAIFTTPQHPYTRGLLGAIPKHGSRGRPLAAISGSVPGDPGALAGCAFAPRCGQAFDRCRAERPGLVAVTADHQSACFLAEPEAG